MTDQSLESVWAIVMAAGKGTRMNSKDINKVALPLAGKPIISHTVSNLRKAGIHNIAVVVGFAKESILKCLDGDVVIAEQTEQLGTGHAVKVALEKIQDAQTVLVLNGDDSYVFTPEILSELYKKHKDEQAAVSFLTLIMENPTGLGRILRNQNNEVIGIIEEKDATEEQRMIQEINPACYMFDYSFLKEELESLQKSPVTGEYYITALIEKAVQEKKKITTHTVKGLNWRGINTPEELKEAEKLIVA